MSTLIEWLGHDSFRLSADGMVVYIDPYQLTRHEPKADLILITHEHFDHFVVEEIEKLRHAGTEVAGPPRVAEQLPGCQSLLAGERWSLGGIKVLAVAAHNTNKFREPGVLFHPPGLGIGFMVELGGERIYHAGDSDHIPEMEGLAPDVALLPVSGTYVMTAEEAAEAVRAIRPKRAMAMHYGSIVGSREDAERFASLAVVPVEVVEKSL